MRLPFRIRKSAGVRVTPAVHRLIRQGDGARRHAHWNEAAIAFRAALAADPRLHHIRLQLGHMLKEAGALDDADAVYAEAAGLCPDDAEPLVHRAHLAKRRRRRRAAIRLFAAALARNGGHDVEVELRDMLDIDDATPSDVLRRILLAACRPADEPMPGASGDQEADGSRARDDAAMDRVADVRPLVFDVTDLVGHFRYQRAPTGIQRVQIEVLDRAIRCHGPAAIGIGCFINGRSGMVPVPVDQIVALALLTRQGGDTFDPEWQEARTRLLVHLALAPHMTLPFRAILVNLGTSLWVSDYFLFIRNAKTRQQISYIPFVHDLIPIMLPDYCVRDIRETFSAWLAGLFHHADGFLANSLSTARDLSQVAGYLGHTVMADRVKVIPLDGDFRPAADLPPASVLDQWGLVENTYVLMVSTIEPRKNHVLALDAWAELYRRHGTKAVPRLVCVGRDGWLNDHVFARLAADPTLISGVTIIQRVSDAEMARLYRSSLFTLYPSHYEGWGLPVTESLCHGRVAVVADNSSLPEASGGFGVMFETNSVSALLDAVERVAFDTDWRREREALIATGFAPRSWDEITKQVIESIDGLAGPTPSPATMPLVTPGAYYAIGLHRSPMIWPDLVDGEIFRIGAGWLWPETGRCRTTPSGGELRIRLTETGGDRRRGAAGARLYLRLHGLASVDCPVVITLADRTTELVVAAGRTAWAVCDIPPATGRDFAVTIRGLRAEEVIVPVGGRGTMRLSSVAVLGLMVSGTGSDAEDRRMMRNIDNWHQPLA